MGAGKQAGYGSGVLGGRVEQASHNRVGIAPDQVCSAADIEQVEFAAYEGQLFLQAEEALLDKRHLAAFRRLVDDDVLPAADEVGKDGDVGLAANEMLSGDRFVVTEGVVHR